MVVGQLLSTRESNIAPFRVANGDVGWQTWNEFRAPVAGLKSEMVFWRGPAMSPVWVLFSSGGLSFYPSSFGSTLSIRV